MPIDEALSSRFGLSRREAECATLLRYGIQPAELAERLGISESTKQKYLASLRAKASVVSTADLIVLLRDWDGDDNVEAYHSWPPAIVSPLLVTDAIGPPYDALVEQCRGKLRLSQMLTALKTFLAEPFGVRYIFYRFAPQAVPSLVSDRTLDVSIAPAAIEAALTEAGPVIGSPVAQKLFTSPDSIAFVDGKSGDYEVASEGYQRFYDLCMEDGVQYGATFGFPSGGSYVAYSITMDEKVPDAARLVAERGEEMRAAAMLMHDCAWTYGALAAEYGLTIREREALSALAMGLRGAEAASSLKVAERTFAGLVAGARKKLGAETNAHAVSIAMSANILVFR